MIHSHSSVATSPEAKLRALCALSGFTGKFDVDRFVSAVEKAPDPETAVEVVLDTFPIPTPLLQRKWRSAVIELWNRHHPNVPPMPALPLSSSDVIHTPFLRDARGVIDSLYDKPALLVKEQKEIVLSSSDIERLMAAMPSLTDTKPMPLENEWGCVPLRRLRQVLQVMRLVRPLKGRLVPVRSRVERFLNLPVTQQYYILWHADTYHLEWANFAGMWGSYMKAIQEYLPLLWENSNGVEINTVMGRLDWSIELLELYTPIWEEEGLFNIEGNKPAILPILQQHALPTIIDTFILCDLFHRHGLVVLGETFGTLTRFTWTKVGSAIIQAELNQEMPCGQSLLLPR